jgi:hypothetical protein
MQGSGTINIHGLSHRPRQNVIAIIYLASATPRPRHICRRRRYRRYDANIPPYSFLFERQRAAVMAIAELFRQ